MTEYAVSLYLDDASTGRLLELMQAAAAICGNTYMLEPKLMPPHITVCYFTTDDINPVIKIAEQEAALLRRGEVKWASLGAFVPSVLFAAPVLSSYLFDTCTAFNARLEPYVKHVDFYRPHNWVPHTTLATKLNIEQLNAAFTAVSAVFKPFGGTAAALSLASCEPFADIKVWKLK